MKLKTLCLIVLSIISTCVSAQFMDPERKRPETNRTTKNDDIFPMIIPSHDGGNVVKDLKQEVRTLSNNVERIAASLTNKLDNNVEHLTNSTDFVAAVKAVSPGGSGKDYDDEISALKNKNLKFQTAFETITNVPIKIESEASIDDLKLSILIIKNAAESVINN